MSEPTQDVVAPSWPVLVLSPHLDDAILSAYAVVGEHRPVEHRPVEIAVVFSGAPEIPRHTPWDRLCGFSDSTEALAARRLENEAAVDGLSITHHFLGLLDGQYLDGVRSRGDADVIADFVGDWVRAHGEDAVVAVPAGAGRRPTETRLVGAPRSARRQAVRRAVGPLGGRALDALARIRAPRTPPFIHPDHVYVRDAVTSAAGRVPALLLYEDLPYSWGAPADEQVAEVAGRLGTAAELQTVLVDRSAKARRVAAYRTQLPYMYAPLGPLTTAAGIPPTERFWWLSEGSPPATRP